MCVHVRLQFKKWYILCCVYFTALMHKSQLGKPNTTINPESENSQDESLSS